MGETIRILIAEQDCIYRDGLRKLIESTQDFTLVAEVDTVSDAVSFGLKLEPDVIIMDNDCTHLPTAHTLEQIQTVTTKSQVLIFSSSENPSDMLRCIEMGARGYLNKAQGAKQLVQSIRLVAAGNMVIDKQYSAEFKKTVSKANNCILVQHFPQLTQRENQIIELLARGLRNRDIAQSCNITEKTVRNHVSNIFSKLNVASRGEAISYIQTTRSNSLN